MQERSSALAKLDDTIAAISNVRNSSGKAMTMAKARSIQRGAAQRGSAQRETLVFIADIFLALNILPAF
ncbi:hypothetical protein RvVAT039_14420 [Agrobacterium vitis]|nr:hypothetical protein RvVAT039_14420 [Agrobacterium vitis]